MDFPFAAVRRLAGVSIVLVALSSLAACSRKDRVFNPQPGGGITWTNTIRHLIADRSEGTAPTGCTGCHHKDTTIPDFTNYQVVVDYKANINYRLGLAPTDGLSMSRFLKPGEPAIIINWLNSADPPPR